MSEWIKIRIKDFYKDAVGETEYAYVSHEVYEALADTFRREAHAEEMRDLRHTTADGYTEGETEDLLISEGIMMRKMMVCRPDRLKSFFTNLSRWITTGSRMNIHGLISATRFLTMGKLSI